MTTVMKMRNIIRHQKCVQHLLFTANNININNYCLNKPSFSSFTPLKPSLNPSHFSPLNNLLPFSTFTPTRFYSSSYPFSQLDNQETDHDVVGEEWEEEDDTDPEIGDGGSGGGIVLQNVPWGEKVLSIAREVLLEFGDDIKLFAFKTTPSGYIYVRLDKLSNQYGCPSMVEVESYSREYKKRLEQEGSKGHIPDDLALEVSSPGAERLLMVPDDLDRFKDFPMIVSYIEEADSETLTLEKTGVFLLDSIETEVEQCVWKLADVTENRDPAIKGKPMNRKQKDWRLKLPYNLLKKVSLYLES